MFTDRIGSTLLSDSILTTVAMINSDVCIHKIGQNYTKALDCT